LRDNKAVEEEEEGEGTGSGHTVAADIISGLGVQVEAALHALAGTGRGRLHHQHHHHEQQQARRGWHSLLEAAGVVNGGRNRHSPLWAPGAAQDVG